MTTSGTLSSVTLAKIESRREVALTTDTDTLICLEDIRSHVRCVEAVTTRAHKRALWTGDKEGNIVIREASTLRPLYQIERKSYNVFVNCLVVAGEGRVWAGLCDGTIRIFDASTYRLLDDFKAHGSEVTDIAVAHMPTSSPELEHHMQVVITSSADWSIGKWDAATGQCLGRLQGHNNTVRCVRPTADGEFLISGGDDGCTRLWSLSANREITYENQPEPCSWPMVCHGGAPVAGLAIIRDEYFVSIGKDGTAHVCLMDGTGAWVKRIEKRPCALTSVLHDSANGRIWIGGIDGIISIVDDRSPEFTPLATVHDHSGAYVSVLRSIGHYVAHNVWTLTSDNVLCRFAESNAQFHGYHPRLMSREDENAVACEAEEAKIDTLREQVVRNYNGLQAYRKELNETERIDSRNFDLIARSSGNTALKRKYFFLAMKWLQKQRTKARHAKAQELLAKSVELHTLRSAYLFWMTVARSRARQHSKAVFADAMLTAKDALSVQRCCVALMEAALKERIRKSLVNVLSQHASTCTSFLRQQYFRRWLEFRTMRRSMLMKRQMVNSILRGPKEAMIRKYWNALVAVRIRKSNLNKQLVMSTLLFRQSARTSMAHYFTLWVRFVSQKLRVRQLEEAGRALREASLTHPENKLIALKYYARWFVVIKARHHKRAREELEATDLEIKNWLDTLRQTEINEEEVERELQLGAEELREKQAMLSEMQRTTRGAQRRVHELKRDLAMLEYTDHLKPSAPLAERVEAVMLYFRAKGIGGVLDFPVVLEAHRAFDANAADTQKAKTTIVLKGKKAPKMPLPPFEQGLRQLKIKLWTIIKARGHKPIETEELWDWGMLEEWVACLRGREAADVIDALKQLIVMYDGSIAGRKVVSEAAMHEFMWNAYLLMSLVTNEAQKSALDYVKEPETLSHHAAAVGMDSLGGGDSPRSPVDRGGRVVSSPTPAGRRGASSSPPRTNARAPSPAAGKRPSSVAAGVRRGVSPAPTARRSSPPRPAPALPSPRPASSALSAAPSTMAAGKILGSGTKPWLGFRIKVTKIGGRNSVTLEQCVENGPAYTAGLREGDELLRFGGVAVTDTRAFNAIVSRAASKPGMLVVAGVSRGRDMVDIPITVGAKE